MTPASTTGGGHAFLAARPFAHRGLHGRGATENGLTAFDGAIAASCGIECDVRLSRDGVAMVFHDATLDRLTAERGALADRTATELEHLALADGSTVMVLSALIDRVWPATPLLIEIKADNRPVAPLCRAVLAALGQRRDGLAIMSFHPLIVRWFATHAPDVVRGLVVTQKGKASPRIAIRMALALGLAKPDFLACDISDLPSRLSTRARARGLPVLTWTVRTRAQRDIAAAHADQIIFETIEDGA